jgi:DNA-binding protein YbaB
MPLGKIGSLCQNSYFTFQIHIMITFKHLSLAAACSLLSLAAYAQSTKPGLWEISSKMDSSNNPQLAKQMEQAQKQMASLPPEQRKMMEEMMAKQGLNISMKGDGSTVVKLCITPEMANRAPIEQQKDCTYNMPARVGNTQRFSFQCTQPVSSGEGEINFKGADDYDGKMKITTTDKGKKETISMSTAGRFLGSNCGAIKPMVVPKS